MATKQTNLRLDVKLIEKYKVLGEKNDRDASYYMRKALEKYVEVKAPVKSFNARDAHENGLNCLAWFEWCDYRKSKRKPISELAAMKQIKMLLGYDSEVQREIINLSIQNDYAGLFPPKSNGGGSGGSPRKQSLTERTTATAEQIFAQLQAGGDDYGSLGQDDPTLSLQVDRQRG